jgi:DNA-binding CsgD family transcriptional regulator
VGRDDEMSLLGQALMDAEGGRGRAVVLAGEAGVGKSRLLRELVDVATGHGTPVLAGRAVDGASPSPFRALAEALLSHLRHRDAGVDEPFRSVLGRLLPGWAPGPPVTGDVTVLLGEAVLRLLGVVAGPGGCVLALEDLHWADVETLSVVEYLADNAADAPVLVLMTARDDEPSESVGWLRRLAARRAVRWVEVRRLDAVETEAMAAACLGAGTVPAAMQLLLAAGAEGLPFLVEELLTAGVDAAAPQPVVPETFADTVRRRLRAAPGADEVLRPAAVLGRAFDWGLLPGITGLPLEEVALRLRRATERRLVDGDGRGGFLFRHALTRAAILADLGAPERAALATRALEGVEGAHPGLPGAWCELAAELADQAGRPERAAALFLEAGRRALGQGALVSAEAFLDRAGRLGVDDRDLSVDVDDALCTVLALAGDSARLTSVGDRLLAGLSAIGASPARVAATHLRLARAAVAAADWSTAERHLEVSEAADAEVDVLAAEVALGRGDPDRAVALARRALAGAERQRRPELACEALEVIGRRERMRDLAAAERSFVAGLDRAQAAGLVVWRVRALHELGTIDLLTGTTAERLTEARAAALAAGALSTAATVGLQLAAWHLNHLELDATVETARAFGAEARRLRMPVVEALGGVFEAAAHALAGRRAEMDAALAVAFDLAGGDPEVRGVAALQVRAAYWLVREDQARALAELDAGMELLRDMPVTAPFRGLWALAVALADRDGEAAIAEVESSGLTAYWLVRGWVGHARAVLLGRKGEGRAAVHAFEAADASLAPCPWYRYHARRLVAEAALTDGWADPQAWLTDALAFFDAEGYDRIASACRALLRRAGAPVPRRRRAPPAVPDALAGLGLTAREVEVLVLLGQARPTREIAAELFVSPKTVERHIANLAAKVGVAGRAELIAFAASRTGGHGSAPS